MGRRIDLTGERFGRLIVIKKGETDKNYNTSWVCKCDCGNEVTVQTGHLRSGHTQSCGCIHDECVRKMIDGNVTHGMSHTPTYNVWRGIMARCYNPNHISYKYYGAKGVTVCKRWLSSFDNFFDDMGEKPSGKSIDRIDSSGNYEPSNCKWSTIEEQNRNMSTNITITMNGETKTVAEWAREYGVSRFPIYRRISHGWSPLDAMLKSLEGVC